MSEREYVIIAAIPDPFATQFRAWQQEFDHWSGHVLPPHITMVRPFRRLPDSMRSVSLTYPLHVTFGDWMAFKNPNANVVWVDPGQSEPKRVADQVHRDYPELRGLDNGRYRPGQPHTYHVTIVNHIPDQDFLRVYHTLRGQPIAGECDIMTLSTFSRTLPDGRWERI